MLFIRLAIFNKETEISDEKSELLHQSAVKLVTKYESTKSFLIFLDFFCIKIILRLQTLWIHRIL